MKLKKRNMNKFDYFSRALFLVSVVLFIYGFVVLQPQAIKLKSGNYLLTDEIAQLSIRNETLKREIDELTNPVNVMLRNQD
jgi:hypothetical protein